MSVENTTKEKQKSTRLRRAVGVIGAAGLLCGAFVLSIVLESRGGSGTPAAPAAIATETASTETAAVPAPATPAPEEKTLTAKRGYFPVDDGLFCPESPFTMSAAAEILGACTGKPIESPGDDALTETTLAAFLSDYFSADAVETALDSIRGQGGKTVTRAEAAVCLNRLLGVSPLAGRAYYPDVEPDYWAYADVLAAAGERGVRWPGPRGKLPQGFINLDGWLYCVDEEGYFLKNRYEGTLLFDANGRYTSGSAELDAYVAAMIAQVTQPDMARTEMLRAVYEYVRDSFTYLKRNYYKVGDIGWAVDEALTMYSTGRGNCYCYSSALWAACRGLGYDAKIVSGTIGIDLSPHGWVEILMDGERYTFDVEIEMAQHRDGYERGDMYMMSDAKRSSWNYIEAFSDKMVSRETNDGLRPQ